MDRLVRGDLGLGDGDLLLVSIVTSLIFVELIYLVRAQNRKQSEIVEFFFKISVRQKKSKNIFAENKNFYSRKSLMTCLSPPVLHACTLGSLVKGKKVSFAEPFRWQAQLSDVHVDEVDRFEDFDNWHVLERFVNEFLPHFDVLDVIRPWRGAEI